MRIITAFSLFASAALLTACVGGVIIPGDDAYSVDVDGYIAQDMQAKADSMCAKHDNMHAVLKKSSMSEGGQLHGHYDCEKQDEKHK